MPDTQPDNLFVKGIKCNVAAKVEGFKHLRPEYTKQGYSWTKQNKTQKHFKSQKKKSQKTQINLSSEQVKFHPIKNEYFYHQGRGGKQDCLQRSSIGC